MNKVRRKLLYYKIFYGDKIVEFVAKYFPFYIPTKKPAFPMRHCSSCGEHYTKIIAIDTGEGWEFDWECENNCGNCIMIDYRWHPFWFGKWANWKTLERFGIETV